MEGVGCLFILFCFVELFFFQFKKKINFDRLYRESSALIFQLIAFHVASHPAIL